MKKGKNFTRQITLLALIVTLAAVSRVPFAVLPNIQPTTFLVIISGYVFGYWFGFVTGILSAFVSNFFLGQGPWTFWQMSAWGICGLLAAFWGKREKGFHHVKFIIFNAFCGYLFGWLMNIGHWVCFVYPLNMRTFWAMHLLSFPFDTLHVFGNIVFSITLGPIIFKILVRLRQGWEDTLPE